MKSPSVSSPRPSNPTPSTLLPPEGVARLRGVWKEYFILTRHTPRLGSWVFNKVVEHLRRTPFYALRDVDLDVGRGKIFGIIGPNGAGKSTLLKVLAGITQPTRGAVRVNGRVASLLEVGVGFHPDLTGMENIFYNAAMHGLSRDEVVERLPQIIAFSGLQDFLYEPVKHYSSGMYARLGCSVALHLEPDVALVDEVLSVGDSEFRARVHRRVRELIESGVTVFLVTHEVGTAADLCDELIWMDAGRIKARGDPDQVRVAYGRDLARRKLPPDHILARVLGELQEERGELTLANGEGVFPDGSRWQGGGSSAPGPQKMEVLSAHLIDEHGEPAEEVKTGRTIRLEVRMRAREAVDRAALRVAVWHPDGTLLGNHISPARSLAPGEEHLWRLRWSPVLWICSEVRITLGGIDLRDPDRVISSSPMTLLLGVRPPKMHDPAMPNLLPARWARERTPEEAE